MKKLLIIFWFLSATTLTQASDIGSIQKKYDETLKQFHHMRMLDMSDQYAQLPTFFKKLSVSYWIVIKQVHQDIVYLQKQMRQCKKNKSCAFDAQVLKESLFDFYKFLKKYRILYEAVYFEQQVWQRFENLFQAVQQGTDVANLLVDFGIEQTGRDGLKVLLKAVVRNLCKVEHDERRLHADWIDAKLSNYVLKIELIRLRNAILFHSTYKKIKFVFSSNYPR